jgi:hypothetical protein
MKKRFILTISATLLMAQIQLKAQCPDIANVFIDACNGTGSEGDNEFMVMRNGNLPMDPATMDIYYTTALATNGTASGNVSSSTYHFGGSGFNNTYSTTELAFIDNLNATNSCTPAAQIFARPVSAATPYTIPANAFFVVLQINQTTTYDWTSFCGQARNQPIYIIFEHNNNGNGTGTTYGNGFNPGGSGRFKNNSGSSTTTPRYFSWKSSTYPDCTEENSVRSYIPSGLPNYAGSANGGTVGWSSAGTPIYSNNGCAASIALPIHLMSFKGTLQEDGVNLTWDAACESSMQEHLVEKSSDGQFYPLAAIPAKNEGCGRTTNYSYTDHAFSNGYQLYRLKMTELTGKITYSGTLSFKGNGIEKGNVWLQENPVNDEVKVLGMETGMRYRITDLTGKTLINGIAVGGKDVIGIASFAAGFYLINTSTATLKFVKQ